MSKLKALMNKAQFPEIVLNIIESDTPEAADMRKILARMIRAELKLVRNKKHSD